MHTNHYDYVEVIQCSKELLGDTIKEISEKRIIY